MSGEPVGLRAAELVRNTVSGHDTATVLHVVRCRTCRASSDLGQDGVRPPAVWAVRHIRARPEHRHFWRTARQRWRADRNTQPPTLSRRTRHAFLLRRAWHTVVQAAGPLFLAGVCGAIGAVLGAVHSIGKG